MSRRAALKAALGAAAAGALPAGAAAANNGDAETETVSEAEAKEAEAQGEEVTPDDLKAFERVADLAFSDEEREKALGGVRRSRAAIRARHEESRKNGDGLHERTPEPPTVFTPVGGGSARGATVRAKPSGVGRLSAAKLSDEDIAFLTVRELGHLLRNRDLSPVRLADLYLDRLKRYGGRLLCVTTLTEGRAREQAQRAERELASGKVRGPLHGIPYGVKDLFATRGVPTEWGAAPYVGQVPTEDATVVRRLEEAGAVLCAKLSVGSLAMGDVWNRGMTRNPWNPEEGSSGSSAGSASAVAAGLVPFAIGTETQGSITSPARRCRVTGLRPTYGRVSRAGAMELSYTMDKPGPLCRDAEDCALVFAALCGADPRDPAAVDRPFHYPPRVDWKKLKVGYLVGAREKDPKAREEKEAVLAWLKGKGANLRPLTLSPLPQACSLILGVEAAAAFDALTRSGKVGEVRNSEWPNIFRAARYVPAVEYLQAQRLRAEAMRRAEDELGDLDLFVCLPNAPYPLSLLNQCGYPEVIIPQGTTTLPPSGERKQEVTSPVSLSFVGRLYGEDRLLAIARAFQESSSGGAYHRLRPDLSDLPPVPAE